MKADFSSFVVDASFAVAWVHGGQATEETSAALEAVRKGSEIFAPSLWTIEIANALLVLVRRGLLAKERRIEALRMLNTLPVNLDHEASPLAFTRISEIAYAAGTSAYDATYVELALRKGLPLACKDGPLRNAARKAGIVIWRHDLKR
jgi:predicted nucleic acid-binding protein